MDLALRELGSDKELSLGPLVADEHGIFSGEVILPTWAALGDYDLMARPTSEICSEPAAAP